MTKREFRKLKAGDLIYCLKNRGNDINNICVITSKIGDAIFGWTVYGEYTSDTADCQYKKKLDEEEIADFFDKLHDYHCAIKDLHNEDVEVIFARRSKLLQDKSNDVRGAYYAGVYDVLMVLTDGFFRRTLDLSNLGKMCFGKIPEEVKAKKQ